MVTINTDHVRNRKETFEARMSGAGPDSPVRPMASNQAQRPKRRNAVKHGKVVEIKGHKFVLTYFKQFTFCGHCTRFLWGVTGPQGYRCLSCDFAIHNRCLEYVAFICPGTSLPAGLEPRPHNFKTASFYHPTFCAHCGSMIYGLFNQGVRCSDCGMTAHHRCQALVPRSCGQDTQEKRGRIKLTLSTLRLSEDKWRINLDECRNLPPMDPNGLADPFVKVSLLKPNGEERSKCQKTERKEKTLDPIFDESFFFDINDKELDHYVYVAVWDWDRLSANDFIGGMGLKVGDIITETCEGQKIDSWYKLLGDNISRSKSIRIISNEEAEQLIDEYRKTMRANKVATLKSDLEALDLRRGSQLVPGARDLPKMHLDDFKLIVVLGKGSFGKVFLAEHKSTKEIYAIKSLKKDLIVQEDDIECTLNERKVLALQGKPPFLTSLHSCFHTRDHLFFVMEFINGGDLMFHILELGTFPEPQTRFYAAEIVLGLLYLHEQGIVYRDLKLDNVMLDSEGHIKIADFGLCKDNIGDGKKTRTFCGTPDYIAPEIISYQPYDQAVDWWALGVLIFEMLMGRPPFDGDDDEELFKNIMERPVHYPRAMSDNAKALIQGFLTKHPRNRLGCDPQKSPNDIKSHKFFQPIDWDKLANRELKPPYKPKIKNKKSYNNFDSEFTSEKCVLSPVDKTVIDAIDPEAFDGFSFTNPELYIES